LGLHLDDATTSEMVNAGEELQAARRSQIEGFRRDSPVARIVELENTEHHCFIQRPSRVGTQLWQAHRKWGFVEQPPGGDTVAAPSPGSMYDMVFELPNANYNYVTFTRDSNTRAVPAKRP
jgi:hypothetical protein